MVTTLHNIGRLLKKRSGSIKRICQKLLEKYLRFQKVVHFSLGENENSKIDVVFLILQRNIKFCKSFFFVFIFWITPDLMNLAANLFMKRS